MKNLLGKVLHLPKKILIGATVVLIILVGLTWNNIAHSQQAPTYQTAQTTKGTLVVSVSASGQVSVANKATVSSQVSGVVSLVFVKNGDSVTAGQQLAQITLDSVGLQRQASAWSAYLSAKNAVDSANANLYTLQNAEFVANQKFMNDAVARDLATDDPIFIEEDANWLAAEAAYKNQTAVIAQAQAAENSAWLSYQASSNIIYAPTAGTVVDLTLTPGMQIGGATTTTGAAASQPVASIITGGTPVISVSIAEVDAPKVQDGQKATLTFDALPNQTFTGKIIGINTTGVVTSGVTTYPATIALDEPNDKILPNMNVTANIITAIKDNVLLVPSSAVQTIGGQTTVRVLQNGTLTSIPVTTGDSTDTQTEIKSGLTDGESVVTAIVNPSTNATSTGSSPFSGGLRFGGFGGGAGGGGGRGGAVLRGG